MHRSDRQQMASKQDPRFSLTNKLFSGAFAPFPRSTWIHPQVPDDSFDLVCKIIWSRAKEVDRGQSSARSQQNKTCRASDDRESRRTEEQQKETDDLGLSTRYEEDKQKNHPDFTLPCPYLLGHRHPHAAKPARVLSPVMVEEMKGNEVEAKGERNSGRDAKDRAPQSGDAGGERSSSPEPQPEPEPQPLPCKQATDTCESEDEQSIRSTSESNSSSDNDSVTLLRLRTCATDSSDDDSTGVDDCKEEEIKSEQSTDESNSEQEQEQDSPYSSDEEDFPPLSNLNAGIQRHPMEARASGKTRGRWVIPLSFHPHDIPTATLASAMTTHAQAPVQGKAEAPQAKSKTNAPPAAPARQEAYDLLADFPALQPPEKPSSLGILRDWNPKTKGSCGKRGLAHFPDHCQESGASHQRRTEKMPHEVSSICAGDQKSVPDLQTFGSKHQSSSATISCEKMKANNQLPPRVAGTDGTGVNARSWASAAKAGMKQAAAPQEKARPCTFQERVTINRAKGGCAGSQKFTKKQTPSHQAIGPSVPALCHGPRTHKPNQFVKPRYRPPHQARGKHSHV